MLSLGKATFSKEGAGLRVVGEAVYLLLMLLILGPVAGTADGVGVEESEFRPMAPTPAMPPDGSKDEGWG